MPAAASAVKITRKLPARSGGSGVPPTAAANPVDGAIEAPEESFRWRRAMSMWCPSGRLTAGCTINSCLPAGACASSSPQ